MKLKILVKRLKNLKQKNNNYLNNKIMNINKVLEVNLS